MKIRSRGLLLGALALLVLLVLAAAVALPRLVDAESYRGLLESTLERQLGREVGFGVMELSIWPVLGLRLDDLVIGRTPEERFDNPVEAESLRVGARLLPLLRGRLEVTSLVVERPVLTLYGHDDGTWEPLSRSGADRTAPGGPASPAPEPATRAADGSQLVIGQLRVTGGRVVVRRDSVEGLRETTLDEVALRLSDLGTGATVTFDFRAAVGDSGAFEVRGKIQPAEDAAGRPLRLTAGVQAERVAPSALAGWIALVSPGLTLPGDLLVERAFSAAATIDYTAGRPARLAISDAVLRDPGLRLVRSSSGSWNYASLTESAPVDATAEEPPLAIHLSDLTIENASARVEDRPARGEAAVLEFFPVRLEVRQPRPDSPLEVGLDARGGIEGRAGVTGRFSVDAADGTRPARVRGKLEATGIDPRDLRLATTLAALPAGMVVGRSFGVSFQIDATLGEIPDVTLREVALRGLDLALERGASGAWSFAPPAGGAAPAPAGGPVLRSEGIELTGASLRLTDRMAAGGPAVLNLAGLRLSLDRLPTAGAAAIELDASVGSANPGRLVVRGKLGPIGEDPAAMPLDLAVTLGETALGDLRFLVPPIEALDTSKATAMLDLRASGAFTRQLEVGGKLSLSGASVALKSPRGDVRSLPFDLRARGNVRLLDSAGRIELPKLELELPREGTNRVLTLRGSVNATSDPPLLDVELLPTRVAADDLAALAALLAPDAPLSFASPDPVELELRARGPLGGETLPALDGRAVLSGFTFHVAGMTQPMERVAAQVTFSSDRVTLDGFGGTIGKSDVTASRVVVSNFESPRVQLDLSSRNADFWELFSFVDSGPSATGDTQASSAADDPLSRLTVEGTLRIDSGSLQTLTFENLTTTMDYRKGVLSLAPLEMDLYGGRFAGKLVQDLNTGLLTVRGNGAGVDADGFLAQNLALGGLIAGRASTELDVQVRAADPANVLSGVSGGGPLQLVEGRLARLEVLKSLSKVTGMFGERSLQRLTKQLATAGTPFRRAETRLSFDAGTLAFEDLVIETTELTLAGRAALDSVTGRLEGRFVVAFSPELSATMQAEKSRAAELFWDVRAQRVSFGFGVSGPATAPSVSVDWDAALRGAAERKLGDELRRLLDRKLGTGGRGGAPAAGAPGEPAPAAPAVTAEPTRTDPATGEPEPAGDSAPEPAAAPPPSTPDLVAEITRTRWTGPVLLRDLSLEGTVRGAGIERASLVIVDARGTEVQKIDRLAPVDEQLAAVADREARATLAWSAKIDGKRLLVARFPLGVTVTVHDVNGRSASASREVDR